jgi:hypothetical protein
MPVDLGPRQKPKVDVEGCGHGGAEVLGARIDH